MIQRFGKFLFSRLGYAVGLVIASIIGGVTTAVVMAAIPDSDGVIHGCRGNVAGGLRVINFPSQQCNGLETPLSWQQSAGGKMYFGKVEYSGQTSGGQTIIDVPGYGKFTLEATECGQGSIQARYENTSSINIDVSYGTGIDPVTPGDDTHVFPISGGSGETPGIMLSSDNTSLMKIASIRFNYGNDINSTSCFVTANAVAN